VVAEVLGVHLARLQARHAASWSPKAGRLSERSLRRASDYISAHLDRTIHLVDLAQEVGLDRYRFLRAFKAATGKSPQTFVREARIEAAKRLLCEGSATLAEVALATGFNSQSHFTTRFRLATGATPALFRNAMQRCNRVQDTGSPAT